VETPITYAEDDGTVVRGTIDLIYRTAAGWHLVDFKTDRLRAEADVERLAAQYAPQVRAYATQWERLTGAPVSSTCLWLADAGQAVLAP
jgi:ATP-dependent helicase/nuclease subunit A